MDRQFITILNTLKLSLFWGACVAVSQPRIVEASGGLLHGGEMRIGGLDYGVKDPVMPMAFDNSKLGMGREIVTGWGLNYYPSEYWNENVQAMEFTDATVNQHIIPVGGIL